ncbi:26S proteasome regulatory subunit family protein [Striga asiatica]|uniref:26S proteasome regulatory subunit family protein n=1 Tax=Striga asiatica TaxID=4170 RepID=A0A5A7NY28_STRAF|nr:26S proteasome regulatory subunit family protein [Striga asiatica]
MVTTNLKAETMKLMEKRSRIEAEMNVIDLVGNLLDPEANLFLFYFYIALFGHLHGFSRSDMDIPASRSQIHLPLYYSQPPSMALPSENSMPLLASSCQNSIRMRTSCP